MLAPGYRRNNGVHIWHRRRRLHHVPGRLLFLVQGGLSVCLSRRNMSTRRSADELTAFIAETT